MISNLLEVGEAGRWRWEDSCKAGVVRELATASVAPGDAGRASKVAGELKQLEGTSSRRQRMTTKDCHINGSRAILG